MAQRTTSNDPNQEILRLKKDIIQLKSLIASQAEQMDDQQILYLQTLKERDTVKEKVKNATNNIKNLQDIVAQKVQQATADKTRQLEIYEAENKDLLERSKMWEKEKEERERDLKNHKEEIKSLNNRLADNLRNSMDPNKPRIDNFQQLSQIKETSEQKVRDLMKQINTLSNQMENVIAENRTLRQMANVPQNFGISLDSIKLYDKEKVDDFKKLIKVLQDDNYKLEEERAKLKHALKVQAMMYKTDSKNPDERYKGLTQDQIVLVDQYVLRILQGQADRNGDDYQLKYENEQLKHRIETLESKFMEGLTENLRKILQNGALGDSKNLQDQQMNAINEMKIMIQQLKEGSGGYKLGERGDGQQNRYNQHNLPKPDEPFEGEIQHGRSNKFNTVLNVADKDGQKGISSSNVYEHAFLQLNLQECFQIIHQKDQLFRKANQDIESLNERIKKYLLTQDNLYKDYIRMERAFQHRENDLKEQLKAKDDQIRFAQSAQKKIEHSMQAMQGGSESIKARVVELTMQNAIIDNNLSKLTRKYQILEEQERLLRKEYHAKDNDMAEKDTHIWQRINDLKEWKVKATEQLRFQQVMLEEAVPRRELQVIQGKYEIEKHRVEDYIMRNQKLAGQYAELTRKSRANQDAEIKLKNLEEDKEQALLEYEILKKRLEHFDPEFKFQNGVFQKIASLIKRSGVAVDSAFNTFDQSGDGILSQQEFRKALEHLHLTGSKSSNNLTPQEFDCLWNSLDVDKSGSIDHREFARKLEYYGLRPLTQEERILTQMVDAVKRNGNGNTMSTLFQMFDRNGKSFITREDFAELLYSIDVKIETEALDKFLDKFWQNEKGGINYKQFLGIFERYQIKTDRAKIVDTSVVSDKAIEEKKKIFDQLDIALNKENKKIQDVFRNADKDRSQGIEFKEFEKLIRDMQFNQIKKELIQEIFNSIDIDRTGQISLPEMISDFKHVVDSSLQSLINENQENRRDQNKIQVGERNEEQQHKVQLITQVELLKVEKRQLQRKLETQARIKLHATESLDILQKTYNSVETQLSDMQKQHVTMMEQINKMKEEAITSIPKDKAENLKIENEKLKDELIETRSGLLSYKSMNLIIQDQVKNLKLSQERKKDEQENLLNALREMQSSGADQERLGKLYYIIMLSRWQEASVNRRYEGVLQEVKELRFELMQSDNRSNSFEAEYNKLRDKIRNNKLDVEKTQNNQNMTLGDKGSHEKLILLNTRIQDLVDNLSEGQETLINLKSKYSEAQTEIDVLRVEAEGSKNQLSEILNNDQDDLRNKMVLQSQKQQQLLLNEMRANRRSQELEERVKYLSALLKNKSELVDQMEAKLSHSEGEIEIIRQQYEKKHTELFKRCFSKGGLFMQEGGYNDDDNDDGGRSRGGGFDQSGRRPTKGGQGNQKNSNRIQNAAQIFDDNLQIRLPGNENNSHSNHKGRNDQDLAATQMRPQFLNQEVIRLQQQVQELSQSLKRKQNDVDRLEKWQFGDKYLSQDEQLKDAMEEYRAQTTQLQEKEQKEMQEAAYKTIKTLQEMLDHKNEAIRAKEDQVERIREQMAEQREIDAECITQLREQLAITGKTTLAKMQEIVSQHDVSNQVQGKRIQMNNSNNDRHSVNELQKIIQEKDHQIRKLMEEKVGHAAASQVQTKYRDEHNDEISRLKSELLRGERIRTEFEELKKKHDLLRKEKEKQNENIINLNNAQVAFKAKLLEFETTRVMNEKEKNQLKAQNSNSDQANSKELQELRDKIATLTKQRDNDKSKLTQSNARIDELQEIVKGLNQNSLKEKEQLENAKQQLTKTLLDKRRLEAQIGNLQEDQKIGGQLGAMSYADQQKRIQQLEQDNRILASQTRTVVAQNKEDGTFEYIGEPTPLVHDRELTSVREILDCLRKWVDSEHRLTVPAIFRALDRHNSGEITLEEMIKGFKKIGKVLRDSEIKLLKIHLDDQQSGYVQYEPLIRELQGIRTPHFIIRPFLEFAKLIDLKGWSIDEFRTALGGDQLENISTEQLKKAITKNKEFTNDLVITDEDIIHMFQIILNKQRILETDQISISKLVDRVREAQKSNAVENIKNSIKRSGTSLSNLLVRFDKNKDGKLTYSEAEELLRVVGVSLHKSLWQDVLIKELLDPNNRFSSISFEMMKRYFGTISTDQGYSENLDLTPNQDRQRPNVIESTRLNTDDQACRTTARQIATSGINLLDLLNQKDSAKDWILNTDIVVQAILEKVPTLKGKRPQVKALVDCCDPKQRGLLVIPAFVNKVAELVQDSQSESTIRTQSMHKYVLVPNSKTAEALQLQIEELKREIQVAGKEVKGSNKRAQDFQNKFENLQSILLDKNSKPPKETEIESENQHLQQEVQKLKDELYHSQQVNHALSKTIQVDLKAELSKITQERESLENKLKVASEKLRVKTLELNQFVGNQMDDKLKKEFSEELRQKQIDDLRKENQELNEKQNTTREKLFKTEELLLDLKFEKEHFDLQYARLQTRITDLENYKLQSSQLSAVMKNQYQAQLEKIREETEKLRGDSLNKQPGDSVKLRGLKTKTAAELETVVDQLKRVVEKQRAENESLKKQNEKLEILVAKGTNEPALRQKIEMLQRVVHSYEMSDVKTAEKDLTIKKLTFANETLRKDLEQEIERFDLLQRKYKDLLIKQNISSNENQRLRQHVFTMTTGANMPKYENFLNDQEEFIPHNKSRLTEDPGMDAQEDSLNEINRNELGDFKSRH